MTGAAYMTTLNYVLGVGVLGIPYAFASSGVLLSTIVVLLMGVASFLTVAWTVEAASLAQLCGHSSSLSRGPDGVKGGNNDCNVAWMETGEEEGPGGAADALYANVQMDMRRRDVLLRGMPTVHGRYEVSCVLVCGACVLVC
jgi:hypothetical protein